jgi:YbbR domain-containing protein
LITFLRQYVFQNIGLKLISLLVAVLLWLAVVHEPQAEVSLTIPIEFQNVPQYLDFTSEHVPQAAIRVQGPERMVRDLDQAEVHATIDLAHAAPGEHTYDLTPREIHVPHGVDVLQVMPGQLRITFDRRITKEIPVRPRVIGSFASGIRIAEIASDPAEVAVVGPEKRVNQIDAALTDPVDATGVIGRANFTTNIYVPDPLVHLAHPEPIHVTVFTEKSGQSGQNRARP